MQAGICEREMYKTFNMGVGYCIICSQRDGDKVVSICKKHKLKASVIGEITKKRKIVIKTEQTFEV